MKKRALQRNSMDCTFLARFAHARQLLHRAMMLQNTKAIVCTAPASIGYVKWGPKGDLLRIVLPIVKSMPNYLNVFTWYLN